MIYVDRNTVKLPYIFQLDKDILNYRQEVQELLSFLFHKKCAYCEKLLRGNFNIDHFRPQHRAVGIDGDVQEEYYSWLKGVWWNLYPICSSCNMMKANRFPVEGPRMSKNADNYEIEKEKRLLLDPCFDKPHLHLWFSENGRVTGLTRQGSTTIEVFGLNRQMLVVERHLIARRIDRELRTKMMNLRSEQDYSVSVSKPVISMFASHLEFAGMCQQLTMKALYEYFLHDIEAVTSFLAELNLAHLNDLLRYVVYYTRLDKLDSTSQLRELPFVYDSYSSNYTVDDDSVISRQEYYRSAKYIERVEIRNFKGIKDLSLSFPQHKNDQVACIAIIGENGVGKTAILQAITIALIGSERSGELELEVAQLLRHRSHSGFVRVQLTNINAPLEVSFERKSETINYTKNAPKVLIQAYGSVRLLSSMTTLVVDQDRFLRVKNLFNPLVPLAGDFGSLVNIYEMPDEVFDRIVQVLRRMLMLTERDDIFRHRGGLYIILGDEGFWFHELSAGYQAVIALCLDICLGFVQRWPHLTDAEGIVVIDEIEAHLHPRWKQQIVTRLRQSFPRITFIISTHDPLCLQGFQSNEIIHLTRLPDGAIKVEKNLPDIQHMRIDQVLVSEYFGLNTTRSQAAMADVERYTELLGLAERTRFQNLEFQALQERIARQQTIGETSMEQLVEKAIELALLNPVERPIVPQRGMIEIPEELIAEVHRQLEQMLRRTRG